jgi:hypothetical protein
MCLVLSYLLLLGLEYWLRHLFGLYWIILMFVIFGNVHFTTIIMPNFFGTNKNTNILEDFFWHILLVITCRIMSTDNPQRRVR